MPRESSVSIIAQASGVLALLVLMLAVVGFLLERAFKFYGVVLIVLITLLSAIWSSKFMDNMFKKYNKARDWEQKEMRR